jgi:hypothetical protein
MIAHIALNEEQFRDLVAGKVVEEKVAQGRLIIRIILSDIGWERMRKALDIAATAASRSSSADRNRLPR